MKQIRLSSSALLRVSSKSLHHLRGSTLALEPLFGDVNQPKRIDIGIQALQRSGSGGIANQHARLSLPVAVRCRDFLVPAQHILVVQVVVPAPQFVT